MTHIQTSALFNRTEKFSAFLNRHPLIIYVVAFFILPALGCWLTRE